LSVIALSSINIKSRARANGLLVINSGVVQSELKNFIKEDGMLVNKPGLIETRFFHNKISVNAIKLLGNYLSHFNPNYLFIQSNLQMPKYAIPGMGLFYFFEIITICVGALTIASGENKNNKWVILLWLLASTLPSALTVETPNPIRTLIGLPAWIMLSAYGLWIILKFKNKAFVMIVILFVLFNFSYFIHQYFVHKRFDHPELGDSGIKELVTEVSNAQEYEKIFVPDDPYIFFLFYNKVDPRDFIVNSEIEPEQVGNWERVKRYKNIYFMMPQECPQEGDSKILYVCKGPQQPLFGNIKSEIKRTDGLVAYYLVSYN
jgi:hypothetical protein